MEKAKFSVEAIVSCDERGQLVLPKEVRKRLKISSGEKMALLNFTNKDDEFLLTLIRITSLEELIKNYMTPVVKDIIK